MELSHEAQDELLDKLVKEFWDDMQDLTTDLGKDILLKLSGYEKETQLAMLIQTITSILCLEIARFTCILEKSSQVQLWDDLKSQALTKSDGFKKIFEFQIQQNLMGMKDE